MYRIGIDVGGTFTDVTLLNSETGAYYTYKLSSTLHDQSEAIANGTKETLALYGVPVEQLEYFGHGTTVATNMIIERKGAKTALITTKASGTCWKSAVRHAPPCMILWRTNRRPWCAARFAGRWTNVPWPTAPSSGR